MLNKFCLSFSLSYRNIYNIANNIYFTRMSVPLICNKCAGETNITINTLYSTAESR